LRLVNHSYHVKNRAKLKCQKCLVVVYSFGDFTGESMQVDTSAANPADFSEIEKAAIQEQVERLLQNSHFSHSRRFPTFLRFVVQHALTGHSDLVKERALGIEIFGRDADYDTASDPIVRVTAAEIRKRIAQYYQDPGHENEIRLLLPAGSYVPQFQFPTGPQSTSLERKSLEGMSTIPSESSGSLSLSTIALPAPLAVEALRPTRFSAKFGIVIVSLCAAAAFLWWRPIQRSAFDTFWQPIVRSVDPVLFCIADQNQYTAIALRDASDPSRQTILKDNLSAVVIDDLDTVVKVAGVLQSYGTRYSLRGEASTNLTDLRNGPAVFVGAFDNAWTLRLTNPLRYHFANDPNMTRFWITDSNNPDREDWFIDRAKQQATNNYRDHAIVARFTDRNTGRISIVAAGIGRGGTIAAGEFLTDPSHLVQALKNVRGFGNATNVEFVLSTEIIDGHPGTPKMEAAYTC